MFVIPENLYNTLLHQGDERTKATLTAENIKQMNNLKVENGGKVTITNTNRCNDTASGGKVKFDKPELSENDESSCTPPNQSINASVTDSGNTTLDTFPPPAVGPEDHTHRKRLFDQSSSFDNSFQPRDTSSVRDNNETAQSLEWDNNDLQPSANVAATQTSQHGDAGNPADVSYPPEILRYFRKRPNLDIAAVQQVTIPPKQRNLQPAQTQHVDIPPIENPDSATQTITPPRAESGAQTIRPDYWAEYSDDDGLDYVPPKPYPVSRGVQAGRTPNLGPSAVWQTTLPPQPAQSSSLSSRKRSAPYDLPSGRKERKNLNIPPTTNTNIPSTSTNNETVQPPQDLLPEQQPLPPDEDEVLGSRWIPPETIIEENEDRDIFSTPPSSPRPQKKKRNRDEILPENIPLPPDDDDNRTIDEVSVDLQNAGIIPTPFVPPDADNNNEVEEIIKKHSELPEEANVRARKRKATVITPPIDDLPKIPTKVSQWIDPKLLLNQQRLALKRKSIKQLSRPIKRKVIPVVDGIVSADSDENYSEPEPTLGKKIIKKQGRMLIPKLTNRILIPKLTRRETIAKKRGRPATKDRPVIVQDRKQMPQVKLQTLNDDDVEMIQDMPKKRGRPPTKAGQYKPPVYKVIPKKGKLSGIQKKKAQVRISEKIQEALINK